FSASRCGACRALHSFPTRRSSDLACLAGETVADQQQWDFHKRKKAVLDSGGTPESWFLRRGLFRYSRHPNYFFELAQWWLVFALDRKSTRLNSSHVKISYAVFCLK